MIAIVDYGAGNLASVKNALDRIGAEAAIADSAEGIGKADRIILPGVGSFGYIMQALKRRKLDRPIRKAIREGVPYLGICLGLQALFERSEESPGISGLAIFKGGVRRFSKGKVPQIGWNRILPKKSFLRKGFAYFVNSYYAVPEDPGIIAATADYNGEFVCAVAKANIAAVQFHPEKSGDYGKDFLERWLRC